MSKNLLSVSESHYNCSRKINQFVSSLSAFCNSVLEKSDFKAKKLSELYLQLALANEKIASAFNRSAEDINDLIERFNVVRRAENEFKEAREKYSSASDVYVDKLVDEKIQKRKVDYYRVQVNVETAILNAKKEKNKACEFYRDKIQNLIDVKLKYNAFKVRRIKSAFKFYSDGLIKFTETQKEIYRQILEVLDELDENGKLKDTAEQFNQNLQFADNEIHSMEQLNQENKEII